MQLAFLLPLSLSPCPKKNSGTVTNYFRLIFLLPRRRMNNENETVDMFLVQVDPNQWARIAFWKIILKMEHVYLDKFFQLHAMLPPLWTCRQLLWLELRNLKNFLRSGREFRTWFKNGKKLKFKSGPRKFRNSDTVKFWLSFLTNPNYFQFWLDQCSVNFWNFT